MILETSVVDNLRMAISIMRGSAAEWFSELTHSLT